LVAAGYNPASIAFPNKGARIGRRDGNNELVPYYDRGAIEAGALDGQKLEICWLKDPFDLLTIQIEGSARVILEDGTPLRISYDSHNGYRYSSIERVLVERNLISRQEMSAQRIRDWMAAHPEEAATVRAANRSYVFFRITGLSNEGEPVGAQGVPLTPGRSIAVDRVHEYGTPFFIEANLPIESGKSVSRFGRLMIAQDTGSALVGPARADLYWGAGDDAGRIAGRIRHPGRFAMLVPRELDLVAAGKHMPLPVPKPKIPEVEVDKTDGKGNAPSPSAGAIATGKELSKHPPSLAPKPKMAASDVKKEIKKEDGKGSATSVNTGATVAGKNLPKHPASLAPKPKMAASDVRKEDGKGSATSANTGATAAGKQPLKHPALPPSKPKVPAIEVKKKDGKGKANSANTANSGEDWRATVGSGRPAAPARMAN
jgi:peptidoglycan lytic transglycosylase A